MVGIFLQINLAYANFKLALLRPIRGINEKNKKEAGYN